MSGAFWSASRYLMAVVLVLGTLGAAAAQAPLRGVALVIGNSGYEHLSPLPNPANDARAIERLLVDLGFETELALDREARRLARDLDIFIEDAEGADVAIVYYAGHGIEAGGENFLVPVDADLTALEAAAERLVPISRQLERLQETVPVTIIMLDACRDNPFPPGATVTIDADEPAVAMGDGGLSETRGGGALGARVRTTENFGSVIAFAAEPGRVALDGAPGENSPYTSAILRHLETMAGEEFGLVMRMVAEEVYLKTKGQQRPWINESLRRLLYFGSAPEPVEGPERAILTERRKLLISIAELAPARREVIRKVAGDVSVPMDGLFAMLDALGADMPEEPAEQDALLRRLADDLKHMVEERTALKSTDAEILRLTALADMATNEGALATAVELYQQAKARVGELSAVIEDAEDQIRARRIEFADVYARSAAALALSLDHRAAARDYALAADEVARWDETLLAGYRMQQARSLVEHGRIRGDRTAFEEAIAILRNVARDTEVDAPARLALAAALTELGGTQTTNAALDEAVGLYREALAKDETASVAAALGRTLITLGGRDVGTERVEEGLALLAKALDDLEDSAGVRASAALHVEMGAAETALARRGGGAGRSAAALAHFEAALGVIDRTAEPLQWAAAELGRAQALRVDRKLDRSIAAFDAVAEFCARDVFPVCWARAQQGRAVALYEAGAEMGRAGFFTRTRPDELARAFGLFSQSLTSFELALAEQRLEMAPLDRAESFAARGAMLSQFAGLSADGIDIIYYAEAARSYARALQEIDPENLPALWFEVASGLAYAHGQMAAEDLREERKLGHQQKALVYLREAFKGLDVARDAEIWAETQTQLAWRLRLVAEETRTQADFEAARDAYRVSVAFRVDLGDMFAASTEQEELAQMVADRGEKTGDAALILQARGAIQEAWRLAVVAGDSSLRDFGGKRQVNDLERALAALDDAALEAAARQLAGNDAETLEARAALAVEQARRTKTAGAREAAVAALNAAADAWESAGKPERAVWPYLAVADLVGSDAAAAGSAVTVLEAALSALGDADGGLFGADIARRLADLLQYTIAPQETGTASLERAVELYRSANVVLADAFDTTDHAVVSRNLGDALIDLAYRGGGADRAREAAEMFEAAAGLIGEDRDAVWHLRARDRQAEALTVLGDVERDAGVLGRSAEIYGMVAEGQDRLGDEVSAAFARTNSARALYLAGDLERDVETLSRSVDELRAAMQVLGRDAYPDSWVWTNRHVGLALTEIAEIDGTRIEEAIEAHAEVLRLRPRETHAWEWAEATHNIARLKRLAAKGDVSQLEAAAVLVRQSTETFREGGFAVETAYGQVLTCEIIGDIASRRQDLALAAEAASACGAAMPVIEERGESEIIDKARAALSAAQAVADALE